MFGFELSIIAFLCHSLSSLGVRVRIIASFCFDEEGQFCKSFREFPDNNEKTGKYRILPGFARGSDESDYLRQRSTAESVLNMLDGTGYCDMRICLLSGYVCAIIARIIMERIRPDEGVFLKA